jgi:hypothetical protein
VNRWQPNVRVAAVHRHVQHVGVAAKGAFLDQVAIGGGQVQVGRVVLGVDVRLALVVNGTRL